MVQARLEPCRVGFPGNGSRAPQPGAPCVAVAEAEHFVAGFDMTAQTVGSQFPQKPCSGGSQMQTVQSAAVGGIVPSKR